MDNEAERQKLELQSEILHEQLRDRFGPDGKQRIQYHQDRLKQVELEIAQFEQQYSTSKLKYNIDLFNRVK